MTAIFFLYPRFLAINLWIRVTEKIRPYSKCSIKATCIPKIYALYSDFKKVTLKGTGREKYLENLFTYRSAVKQRNRKDFKQRERERVLQKRIKVRSYVHCISARLNVKAVKRLKPYVQQSSHLPRGGIRAKSNRAEIRHSLTIRLKERFSFITLCTVLQRRCTILSALINSSFFFLFWDGSLYSKVGLPWPKASSTLR